jgi:hypothetical protein
MKSIVALASSTRASSTTTLAMAPLVRRRGQSTSDLHVIMVHEVVLRDGTAGKGLYEPADRR